jgi:hypothetical protein
VVDEEGEDGGGYDKELDAERVVLSVVRGLELDVHEIEGAERTRQVEHLHDRVVERDKVREQVQVASKENEGEEHLTASGYT